MKTHLHHLTNSLLATIAANQLHDEAHYALFAFAWLFLLLAALSCWRSFQHEDRTAKLAAWQLYLEQRDKLNPK